MPAGGQDTGHLWNCPLACSPDPSLDRRLPRSPEIGDQFTRPEPEESDWASFRENSASLRGKSRRARGHAIFTSDFRRQANALNSMAFQRVLRAATVRVVEIRPWAQCQHFFALSSPTIFCSELTYHADPIPDLT